MFFVQKKLNLALNLFVEFHCHLKVNDKQSVMSKAINERKNIIFMKANL